MNGEEAAPGLPFSGAHCIRGWEPDPWTEVQTPLRAALGHRPGPGLGPGSPLPDRVYRAASSPRPLALLCPPLAPTLVGTVAFGSHTRPI